MSTYPVRIGVQLQPQHADYSQIRDAVLRAEADLEALLASRPYPLRQLLKDGEHWSEEHWIAEIPGAGTMVYGDQYSGGGVVFLGDGGGMVPFAGLSDVAQSLARSLSFRPSDEDADPGLAKRFAAARDTIHPRTSFFDDEGEFVMLGDGTRVPGPTLGELLAAVDRPTRDRLGRGLGLAAGVDPLRRCRMPHAACRAFQRCSSILEWGEPSELASPG